MANNYEQLLDTEIRTSDGSALGRVEQVYVDTETGRPEWAEVKTGMFGSKRSLVPLAVAENRGDVLQIPFDKDFVKGAPHHEAGVELSPQDEAAFFDYYGIPYGGETVTAETGAGGAAQGRDISGPTTDEAMTRSEEELRVGTTSRETGRVRLRKHIVTENVQTTVPVRRKEVRIEREPITDANLDAAMSGPELSEEEHEVVLHQEEPVVEKRVVPKERVRLGTEVETGEAPVSAEVRKEQIETEGRPEPT